MIDQNYSPCVRDIWLPAEWQLHVWLSPGLECSAICHLMCSYVISDHINAPGTVWWHIGCCVRSAYDLCVATHSQLPSWLTWSTILSLKVSGLRPGKLQWPHVHIGNTLLYQDMLYRQYTAPHSVTWPAGRLGVSREWHGCLQVLNAVPYAIWCVRMWSLTILMLLVQSDGI